MVQIVKYRNIYYAISGTLIALSVFAFLFWGLKLGIDFKGGSLLFGEFSISAPANNDIQDALIKIDVGETIIQQTGERGVILRFKEVDEPKHQEILKVLEDLAAKQDKNAFTQKSFESVGPSIGKELQSKSITAGMLVLSLVIGYIAFAFRGVSYPLASWKYGIATLAALFHDIIIPIGLFAVLGHFYNIEISSGFIAAILTVLGYSVHDSIIVFDRIRENLIKHHGRTFDETVNISINQTFVRSINTSLTVILVLLSIYFLGGESIKYSALALMVGVGVGTYSSIFIGSTILTSWYAYMYANPSKRK
ncbi:protein-export membrane protein SecF [Candidatus Azambacteria bacterium RIFCSPHIGHO2_02_FULL_52_12]|uniref:Protein-export membrane protein SecF n=1 Tax=Candidatus Azambacteria bacterium RIFCSPLOWO2_01_FULL_46_25 TaxID=1797298 RepID=A0A1F5BVU6_9BACT|nr:MAG: protein-export membrane protein SecF [Candidatus Azambacteria bacterium RIFCSPHIGHO2_02_FULL_52_12]OGD34729.1 MAG: protein-export membrane protein SecF [Candidatus Azambacteria bacterium RIFCSPLOWO2_01_FULL_46_25]OGD36998.1 MAG: protein-export membrane protein SecF [Candidatus Azambacteria bacterium RIFCSPHIGHO2_01_FULL_51_74]